MNELTLKEIDYIEKVLNQKLKELQLLSIFSSQKEELELVETIINKIIIIKSI